MAEAECTGAAPAGGLWRDVQEWGDAEVSKREERRESSAGEDRRLKPIYTPLDMTSFEFWTSVYPRFLP